jgi:hypothetical protein
LYKPKYLVLMVLATWLGGFGALVPTWFERWGRFGLDPAIGSCSILPDVNGRSPKEFLFILAFLAPCIAIVVCYARIFYIVRKTALKSRRRDEATKELVRSNFEVTSLYFLCALPIPALNTRYIIASRGSVTCVSLAPSYLHRNECFPNFPRPTVIPTILLTPAFKIICALPIFNTKSLTPYARILLIHSIPCHYKYSFHFS